MKHNMVFSKGSLVLALTLITILLVTACAPTSESTVVQTLPPKVESLYKTGTYLVNDSDFASKKAADWSSAETIRVELGEYYFKPANLTFEAGKPYKVELVNVVAIKHEFTADDCFAAFAWLTEATA